ncbi:glycoside hydrolase family 16 protein [Aeromicrobium sp.]|uniref:glycoside hydrolase family 16 protein n=1 Tax=Aeromicrobium sp. TaxID=1871063 RepID=UPI004034CCAC
MSLSSMTARGVCALAAGTTTVALVLAACGPAPLPQPRAGVADGDLRASVVDPLVQERFSISGRLNSSGVRTVRLEQFEDEKWVKIDRPAVKTTAAGAFSFDDVSIDTTTAFRASSRAQTLNGTARAAINTKAIRVSSGGDEQDAEISTLPEIAGTPSPDLAKASAADGMVQAQFEPARPGRVVEFSGRSGDTWKSIGEAKQDDDGVARIRFSNPAAAEEWRARAVEQNGLDAHTVADEPTGWEEQLREEFTETRLPEEWTHRLSDRWLPGRTCAIISEDATEFPGGEALIRTVPLAELPRGVEGQPPSAAKRAEACVDARGKEQLYAGGMISTAENFTFEYGTAAARVRFDERRGQHGAFWLQTNEANDTEIDIIESFGRRDSPLTVTLHRTTDSDVQSYRYKPPLEDLGANTSDWFANYHIYSVEWSKDEYIFRIDGREVFRSEEALSSSPHFAVLSNIVANYEIPYNDGTGADMSVDWVRIWQ